MSSLSDELIRFAIYWGNFRSTSKCIILIVSEYFLSFYSFFGRFWAIWTMNFHLKNQHFSIKVNVEPFQSKLNNCSQIWAQFRLQLWNPWAFSHHQFRDKNLAIAPMCCARDILPRPRNFHISCFYMSITCAVHIWRGHFYLCECLRIGGSTKRFSTSLRPMKAEASASCRIVATLKIAKALSAFCYLHRGWGCLPCASRWKEIF